MLRVYWKSVDSTGSRMPQTIQLETSVARTGHGRGRKQAAVRRRSASVCTLTILIPHAYNPDKDGKRKEIESSKLKQTEAELRQHFSGYSLSETQGWYRSPATGEEFEDKHLRFEIDLKTTPGIVQFLRGWKRVLEKRFRQEAIYMRLSGPIAWL
jgi:hypothetical protein